MPSRAALPRSAATTPIRMAAPRLFGFTSWLALLLLLLGCTQAGFGQAAKFAFAQTTVYQGKQPQWVAFDPNGNRYVSDNGTGNVTEIPLNCSSPTCQLAVYSGGHTPEGIAFDKAGDLFIALYSNGSVIKIPFGCTSASCTSTVPSGVSAIAPIAVDAAGDVFINSLSSDFIGEVEEVPAGCTTSACQLTFVPSGDTDAYAVAVSAAGDLFIGDGNSGNIVKYPAGCTNNTCEASVASGFGGIQGLAVDSTGKLFVADKNHATLTELPVGCSSPSCGISVGTGLYGLNGVAVDANDNVLIGDPDRNEAVEVSLVSANFGSANVCPAGQGSPAPCSQTETLNYTITTAGTFGTPVALTQGAQGLDFQVASNSCAGAHNAGDQCSVTVNFAPIAPGARNGAVQLVDANGKVLVSTPVYGQGVGPAIAFNSGQQITFSTGASSPSAIAVDGAGNIYILDGEADQVVKVALDGSKTTVIGGLKSPNGLAIDGAGNLYIADTFNNRVLVLPPGGGGTTTVGSGLHQPVGVAVDGQGNVFIADTGSGRLLEVLAASGVQKSVGAGFSYPVDVAVDGLGNIFVVDGILNSLIEIPAGGGAQRTLTSDLSTPHSLALDGADDVLVADRDNNRVIEVPAAGGPVIVLTSATTEPQGVVVDASGNVLFTDENIGGYIELPRSQPPFLAFAATSVGSTSSDSPKSVLVQSVGNQPLDLAYTLSSAGGSYTQVAGSGTPEDCSPTSAFTLAPGASCNLSLSFTPQAVGPSPGSVVFADNTLNATAATQTLNLSGTGNLVANTLSFTSPMAGANYTYGQQVQAVVSTNSSAPVAYSATGAATVSSSGLISFVSTGAATVTAKQAAQGVYTAGQATVTVNVNAAATVTTLTTLKGGSNTATLTANVSPAQPGTYPTGISGTVTFFDNGTQIGSPVAVVNGVGSITTPAYTGSQTFTAMYNGSTLYQASPLSNSTSLTFTVNPTITFTTAPSYSYGQSFQLMATSNSSGAFTYSLVSGPATVTASGLVTITGEGAVKVQASEAAATGYNAGTAMASFNAVKAGSNTALKATAVKAGFGTAASLVATVSPQFSGTPTGQVTFYDGNTALATVAVSGGTASYTTGQLTGAQHSFTAVYGGDGNFNTSTSQAAPLSIPVTAVTLSVVDTKLIYPLPPVFSVNVAPASGKAEPTGTVTIYDGAKAVASLPLYAITKGWLLGAVLPPLSVGQHTLTAVYSGDANYAPGTSAPVVVTVTPGPVRLQVNCNNRVKAGQTLTCLVNADEGVLPVTGTVTYSSTGGNSGSVTLNASGQATISYTATAKGSYTLSVNYAAQGNYQAAQQASSNYTVN